MSESNHIIIYFVPFVGKVFRKTKFTPEDIAKQNAKLHEEKIDDLTWERLGNHRVAVSAKEFEKVREEVKKEYENDLEHSMDAIKRQTIQENGLEWEDQPLATVETIKESLQATEKTRLPFIFEGMKGIGASVFDPAASWRQIINDPNSTPKQIEAARKGLKKLWNKSAKKNPPVMADATVSELWDFIQERRRFTKEREDINEGIPYEFDTELGAAPEDTSAPKRVHNRLDQLRVRNAPGGKELGPIYQDNLPYQAEPMPYAMFRAIHNKFVKATKDGGKEVVEVSEDTIQKRYQKYIYGFFPEIKLNRATMNRMARFIGDPDLKEIAPFDDALMRYIRMVEAKEMAKRIKREGKLPAKDVPLEAATVTPEIKEGVKLGQIMKGQRGALDIHEIAEELAKVAKNFEEFRYAFMRNMQNRPAAGMPLYMSEAAMKYRQGSNTALDPILEQIYKNTQSGKKSKIKLLGKTMDSEEVNEAILKAIREREKARDAEVQKNLKEIADKTAQQMEEFNWKESKPLSGVQVKTSFGQDAELSGRYTEVQGKRLYEGHNEVGDPVIINEDNLSPYIRDRLSKYKEGPTGIVSGTDKLK